jgi:hypothetical protein
MQMKLLEQGNATMGVWLGKNILDQVDEVRHVNGSGLVTIDFIDALLLRMSRATATTPRALSAPESNATDRDIRVAEDGAS